MPVARHSTYQQLAPEWKRTVSYLIPLVRIADSLDRGHEQRVEDLACDLRNGAVVLTIQAKGDTELEQWAAERTGDAFRQVYEKPLVVSRGRATG